MWSIKSSRRTFSRSAIVTSLKLLNSSDRKKLFAVSFLYVVINLLDLIGVMSIGLLGALSVQGIESKSPGKKVSLVLNVLHINNLSFQNQISIIGVSAALMMVAKSLLSMYFSRRILYFLSFKSAQITSNLISGVLNLSLIKLQKRTNQEILFIVTDGVRDIMVGILGSVTTMISDISLLILLSMGLFFVNPYLSFSTFAIFSLVAFLLHKFLRVRAASIGRQVNELQIKSNEKILEVLNSYRESVVKDRRNYYAKQIGNIRYDIGGIMAEMNFQPFISKYVIELTFVMGSLALASFEFLTSNAVHAISMLTIFMATSSRITPAVLRIQQNLLTLKQSSGAAQRTFDLINEIPPSNLILKSNENVSFNHIGFEPKVEIDNLKFSYGTDSTFEIKISHLTFKPGETIAIVGPSGAGKTTVVDLILGVLEPDLGQVSISGVEPLKAAKRWPGAIAYVPQNIFVSAGTVRENVTLGFPSSAAPDEQVWDALKLSYLDEVINLMPNKLETRLGEFGSTISGGQKQRLGIARALFTKPNLLVLDEATSALDAQSEAAISKMISNIGNEVTVIIVAHRLSTVRIADVVVYVENGEVLATGSFEKVRKTVPNFDQQAKLMGL